MKFSHFLPALVTASRVCALPAEIHEEWPLALRADASLVGYLGVFFLGSTPSIYFYLSNGNNAILFSALNGGNPVIVPTLGTGGVRDPSIISGGGTEAGKKWYIIGTDLDIAKTTWDASQRTGSRGIYVWESTNMVTWTSERLVVVEDSTAGMVWAPDAIWDSSRGQYLVHWASRFYATSDTSHTAASSPDLIRYSHTSDFKTFTSPSTYISATPSSLIDLCILPLGNSTYKPNSYARFLKNETATTVYMERSDTGLFGAWTRSGGATASIRTGVEGPYAWKDNLVEGKVNLLLDYFGGGGYAPFYSDNLDGGNTWVAASTTGWPTGLRHGSVLGVTGSQYAALGAAY